MNNNETSQGYSKTFWCLVGAGIFGIAGGFYYIYSLFNEEIELDEEQEIEVEKLTQDVKEKDGELNVETAIKIMSIANKVCEDTVRKNKPDIDQRRRDAFQNNEEYEKICYEYLEGKEYAYQNATQLVLGKFNITMDNLQKVLTGIPPFELEKKLYAHEKPDYDDSILGDDKYKIKEAFVYFGNKFMQEMKSFYNSMTNVNQSQQEYIMLRLMILKLRVDDDLFFKFKVNEIQLRYLLYKNELYDDLEVKAVHDKISKFDEMINIT